VRKSHRIVCYFRTSVVRSVGLTYVVVQALPFSVNVAGAVLVPV
jgi:hypothetical protein